MKHCKKNYYKFYYSICLILFIYIKVKKVKPTIYKSKYRMMKILFSKTYSKSQKIMNILKMNFNHKMKNSNSKSKINKAIPNRNKK